VDSSGNGLNGTVLGSSPTYSSDVATSTVPLTGAPNNFSAAMTDAQAYSFNYPFPFNSQTNATVEFWIKPAAVDWDFLWTETAPGDDNRFNIHAGGGQICADYRSAGQSSGPANGIGCSAAGSVPAGQWTYFAIVKQGNEFKMYANNAGTGGATVLVGDFTGSFPNLPTNTSWSINGRDVINGTANNQSYGKIDELRLSNAALTVPQLLDPGVVVPVKSNQTITFASIPGTTYGAPDFALNASADSGLTVSYAPSGNCTMSGSTVHITGAGSCSITASQAGNASYNAAPNVVRSFNIAKANQTITFGALATKRLGDADFAVSASASLALTVSFTSSGNCTVSVNTVHLVAAGSCTITAHQAGNANYFAAPDVSQTFTILPPHPTNKDQCKNNGYLNYVDDNNQPFKNQGQCVAYTNHQ
jgi:hypothetical protein